MHQRNQKNHDGKINYVKIGKNSQRKNVTKKTKIKIVETLVFPIVTNRSESWTMRKKDRKKILMHLNCGYDAKFKECRPQKGKQRHFAESETKHLVRSHNKNAENAIFPIRDEGTSILGEIHTAGRA